VRRDIVVGDTDAVMDTVSVGADISVGDVQVRATDVRATDVAVAEFQTI
jgi:hypothetical protein